MIVDCVDCVATLDSATGAIAVACINKHETDDKEITLKLPVGDRVQVTSLIGNSPDDYNDIGRNNVYPIDNSAAILERTPDNIPFHTRLQITFVIRNRDANAILYELLVESALSNLDPTLALQLPNGFL